jgi:hypothetical protein
MELMLRRMARSYLPYTIDQRLLLPPDMRAWLPEGHLALFILDVVSVLDLSAIHAVYESKDDRGRAGYDPTMMVALLGACRGKSRRRRGAERLWFRREAGPRLPAPAPAPAPDG